MVAPPRDPARLLVTVAAGGEDRRGQRGQPGRLGRPQPVGHGAAGDPAAVLVVDERLVHALVDGGEVRVVRRAYQGRVEVRVGADPGGRVARARGQPAEGGLAGV